MRLPDVWEVGKFTFMYANLNSDSAWAARANVDFVLEALAHASMPTWEGSGAQSADSVRWALLAQASQVRELLHLAAVQMEELEELEAAAMREAG